MTVACPHCKAQVIRPAREGGIFLRARRGIRIAPSGTTVVGCPSCGTDLALQGGPQAPRLLVFRKLTSSRMS